MHKLIAYFDCITCVQSHRTIDTGFSCQRIWRAFPSRAQNLRPIPIVLISTKYVDAQCSIFCNFSLLAMCLCVCVCVIYKISVVSISVAAYFNEMRFWISIALPIECDRSPTRSRALPHFFFTLWRINSFCQQFSALFC